MPIPNIPTSVTVAIEDGEGVNKGTFSITVVNTIPAPPAPMETMVETEVSGSFSVTATEIIVTLEMIPGAAPSSVQDMKDIPLTGEWKLMDNELTITSRLLVAFGVAPQEMPSLTLTKQ